MLFAVIVILPLQLLFSPVSPLLIAVGGQVWAALPVEAVAALGVSTVASCAVFIILRRRQDEITRSRFGPSDQAVAARPENDTVEDPHCPADWFAHPGTNRDAAVLCIGAPLCST